MSSFKPYPEYKDSNHDWLGDIPSHWETINGQFLFKIINEKSKTGEELLLSVSEKKGVTPRSEANVTMFLAESYKGYKLCKPGDLVINSMWAWSNGLGFSKHEGIISTAYSVYRPNHKLLDYRFYNYLLKTERYVGQYEINSKGIWTSRLMLSDWAFLRMPILLPPKPEQTAIAIFLDSKTAEIQDFIALKEKTIELLKERKTAIINQAVTKGLDPNVEMKDSGIEWLGEIPKHWEVKKLKYLSINRNNQRVPIEATLRGQMKDRLYDYYGATGVIDKVDNYIYNEELILIAEDGANLLMRNIQLVYIAKGKYWVNNHAHIVQPRKFMDTEYLANTMEMYDYTTLISGSAQPKLTKSAVMSIDLLQPPLDEQISITEYVNGMSDEINLLISQAEKEISLIKEYRQSLISDAVTGKIDVRDWEQSSKSYSNSEAEDKLSMAAEESPEYERNTRH